MIKNNFLSLLILRFQVSIYILSKIFPLSILHLFNHIIVDKYTLNDIDDNESSNNNDRSYNIDNNNKDNNYYYYY